MTLYMNLLPLWKFTQMLKNKSYLKIYKSWWWCWIFLYGLQKLSKLMIEIDFSVSLYVCLYFKIICINMKEFPACLGWLHKNNFLSRKFQSRMYTHVTLIKHISYSFYFFFYFIDVYLGLFVLKLYLRIKSVPLNF